MNLDFRAGKPADLHMLVALSRQNIAQVYATFLGDSAGGEIESQSHALCTTVISVGELAAASD
jgi:hypothetical protein